jgi:hypothetical protein
LQAKGEKKYSLREAATLRNTGASRKNPESSVQKSIFLKTYSKVGGL